MPAGDDDTPRLAEIARTLADFRAEFRSAISDMLRKDVYQSDRQGLQMQIDAIKSDVEKDRTDRKTIRNLGLGAIFTALVSLVMTLLVK